VSACYSEYPVEYREHLAEEHHSRKRILDRAREGFTLVLEYEGRIMGSGTLIGDSIQGVFVHPSHQRKGFGKAIMRELEERALEKGVKTVSLESTPLSKGFYDSLGYATLEEATFSVGKRSFTYYKMAKELRAREAPHSG
ncbi:MAG: GNAT family N-acetyltransferase, partial [Thermoproteota archaeon]